MIFVYYNLMLYYCVIYITPILIYSVYQTSFIYPKFRANRAMLRAMQYHLW